jgi:hypothetical protein
MIATIAVYVFIIINGMYPIFLALGELWIVFIFLLGFFYIITRRLRGDGGGKKGGGMSGIGGGLMKGASMERLVKKGLGAEASQAAFIESKIELLESSPKGSHGLDSLAGRIESELQAFGSETSVFGKSVGSDYKRLMARFREACRDKGVKTKAA